MCFSMVFVVNPSNIMHTLKSTSECNIEKNGFLFIYATISRRNDKSVSFDGFFCFSPQLNTTKKQ